jgi:succinate dehydrogenase flavin-adding protein (antitoxin of CptAB toxin-antitoxin module)
MEAFMVKIGQAIEGISLNGYEWLLEEEDGDIKWFDSYEEAEAFLLQTGANEEDLYLYKFVDENGEEVGIQSNTNNEVQFA